MVVEVSIRYFANLRERAGVEHERIDSDAVDLAALYEERSHALDLGWPREHLRVAANGAFVDWSRPLRAGDEIVFIPPVSGG